MTRSPLAPSQRSLVAICGLAAVLLLTWLVYRPGLTGGFQFDDFVNLDALGQFGRIDNWGVFWRYVTSGDADPLGRPLSLLSFLLDARDWPADPYPFLRTNLLLHLLNGALLFGLLRLLGRVLNEQDSRSEFAALICAGCWLLHPLFVSTTLYVVQREAMLPATFTLLGLIAYTHGRVRYSSSGGNAGLSTIILGTAGATFLAILSKANGVLLPLLALVLEWCILRPRLKSSRPAERKLLVVLTVLLGVPTLVVGLYLLRPLMILDVIPANRAWTIGQRLLTEPRVMMDYLQLLFVPRSISTGLFNDGYVASRSLLHPWTTLASILALIGLLLFSLRQRRVRPDVSCALLFFFVGHLLESSSLPLELYFEHRNYLPGILLFWPIARALSNWKVSSYARYGIAVLLLGILAGITWQRASLWGQPRELARIWAAANPGSARAQTVAAISDKGAEGPVASLRRLLPLWREHPYELQFAFNVIDARCAVGGPLDAEKRAVALALRNSRQPALMTHQWLANAIEVANAHRCRNLSLEDVDGWVRAALANPSVADGKHRDQDFEPLLGMLALYRQRPDEALEHLDRALRVYPNPDQAARQTILLASNGYYDQALAHLDTYEDLGWPEPRAGMSMGWVHQRVLAWQGYWPRELGILRAKILKEKAKEHHD